MPKGLYCTAVFLFLLFSTPNIWGHWTDLNQTWHTFTYDCYLKNLVLSPPGVLGPTTHGLGEKPLFETDFELWPKISLQRNIMSNQQSERNSSIYKDFPPPNLVNFGPQTAKNGGRVSAQPLKIARRMSCRLTFARHFDLVIFARWRTYSQRRCQELGMR